MPSGGARNRSGPPPDPTALVHGDGEGWLRLPGVPSSDRAPAWPLTRANARERTFWVRLWKMPQARIWREHHQELEVAIHARSLAAAEAMDASTASRTLIRQQMDSLLLTLPALRAAKILLVDKGMAAMAHPTGSAPAKDGKKAPSGRARLKVLQGDGGT